MISRYLRFVLVALFLPASLASVSLAQKADPADPRNQQIGADLIKQAIAARGGDRYLGFKTVMTTGQFTPYDKGLSQSPIQFTDWIVYPDKERTDFGKGKKKDRRIQVNIGKTGWVYDGDAQTLKDQTDAQIRAHLEGLESDIDRVLRSTWKEPGAEVRFAGREELRPGERADVVEIKLKSDHILSLWLDRSTHLPINLIYEKIEDGKLIKREVRFFQYIVYDGVKFPNIIDFYRDGLQESRINFQTIKLDAPMPDELFAKPANIKEIK
ncbi:MAG: hypothetical protein SF339_29135 [Blastocatellia bacterium]|nr:hypothetical protein [Blastocatellia bacterium]